MTLSASLSSEPEVQTSAGRRPTNLLRELRAVSSIGRLHIVAIASLGTFTFGWLFTGRHLIALAGLSGLDWFLVNLLNRVVDRAEDTANGIAGSFFVARHRRFFTVAALTTLLLSLPIQIVLAPSLTGFRLAYHLLGAAYNYSLRPGWRRLKQLYFFKNTASAVGFLLTVFAYPLAASASAQGLKLTPGVSGITILVAVLFFFPLELSYEVIYDLRDAPGDALVGVRSYPVVHGVKVAARIIDALLLCSLLVLSVGYLLGLAPWRLFIMICAPIIQLIYYKIALARGITSAHCVRLTWVGAALLVIYHLWIHFDLPGAGIP